MFMHEVYLLATPLLLVFVSLKTCAKRYSKAVVMFGHI